LISDKRLSALRCAGRVSAKKVLSILENIPDELKTTPKHVFQSFWGLVCGLGWFLNLLKSGPSPEKSAEG